MLKTTIVTEIRAAEIDKKMKNHNNTTQEQTAELSERPRKQEGRAVNKQIEEARRGLSASELGHVDEAAPERAPGYVLLPGDPNRVPKMAAQWDGGAKLYTLSRGLTAAVGT